MGVVDPQQTKTDRIWNGLFIGALLAGIILRLKLASLAMMPGHGDSAFYYTVAKNIVDGRGLVVDYIVYYFNGLVPITHYAADFWNPLAEILISLPMMAFGKSIFVALTASITAGLVPPLVGYFAAKYYSQSVEFAALAGILTIFAPYLVWVSSITEAIIFSGAFGTLAIYFAIKGRNSPRYFLFSALCTGLTQFVRQDGVLLLFTLLVCILVAPIPWKKKMIYGSSALGIHILVLLPLMIRNYFELHALFPVGPAQTMFLTTYEDFHSYGKELDWTTLRATWGILGIIQARLHTAVENFNQIKYFVDPALFWIICAGILFVLIVKRKTRDLSPLLPVLLFAFFEFAFYTVLAAFSGPGSLPKGLAILLPFLSIFMVELFEYLLRSKVILTLVVIALAAYSGYRGYQGNAQSTLYYNGIYVQYKTVQSVILTDASEQGISSENIVVMSRNTWDVYEGTGFKSIMVPNNDLETIYEVAKHYSAEYILLPAPRKALDGIYSGSQPDPRFILIGQIAGSDWKIFRIK